MGSSVVEEGLSALLRNRMRAQADLFAALTSHPTLIGSGRETALAELLAQVVPRRYELLSGAIAKVDGGTPTKSTHQLDLIVADTLDYPTLLRVGQTAIVLSPSVRGLVEIKSNLRKGATFITAVAQVARARMLLGHDDPVFTALFSFGGPKGHQALRRWLIDLAELRGTLATGIGTPGTRKVIEDLLADKGVVDAADAEELRAILAPRNLPDLIVTDRGALAQKQVKRVPAPGNLSKFLLGATSYAFVRPRDGLPAVMALLDSMVAHLSSQSDDSVRKAFAIVRLHLGVELESVVGVPQLHIPP